MKIIKRIVGGRCTLPTYLLVTLTLVACVPLQDNTADIPTPRPISSPTRTPTATSIPITPLGDSAFAGNWKITVFEGPYILKTNDDDIKGVMVVIRVRVKNVGREGSTIWRNQFELEDARGIRYDSLKSEYGRILLVTADLNPGLQTEGFLMFDVPPDVLNQRWYLAFGGALFEQQSAYIDLGQDSNWDDRR